MDVKKWLEENRKESYRDFSTKLTKSKYDITGVAIPKLRQLAKQLVSQMDIDALECLSDESFEEIMLQGFVIAYNGQLIEIKEPFMMDYLSKCDNWSLIDSFAISLTFDDYEKELFFDILLKINQNKQLIESNSYIKRFVLVSFLKYLDDEHIDTILKISAESGSDIKTIQMANGWLLATASIDYYPQVKKILNRLDQQTLKYYRQKMSDSYRISQEMKKEVKGL